VDLVRTDVSEELISSFIRVTRIGELGTMLAVITTKLLDFVHRPDAMRSAIWHRQWKGKLLVFL
jgi:hypothetical protein